jgi:hypothetical protein
VDSKQIEACSSIGYHSQSNYPERSRAKTT